ncbi:MAG TPA: EamA family transporter [Solirubrobacteraceae bacterium]|nr:EamA family transporter [Solirubrobacteraceae bacterium]
MADAPAAPAPGTGTPGLARVPAVALVAGGITSTQLGAAMAGTLFDELDAASVAVLRLGFAAIVLFAVFRPKIRGRPREDLLLAGAFGLTLGAMNLTFYESIERIPLGIAVTIEFAGPLAVAVLGSRRRLDFVWVALAAAGILVLADPGGGSLDTWGLVLAGMAGVGWFTYILLSERTGQRFSGAEAVALAMVVAALVPLGPGVAEGAGFLLEPEFLAIGLGVAVMSSAIPYTLETEALRRMPKNVFGVLMSLEPGVAALAGFLVLGQELGVRELVAIALVVTASAGATLVAGRGASFPEPE